MDYNKDLTFLFYELFEEKKRIKSYTNKERKKLEYAQKENQKKVDEMQSALDRMIKEGASDCIEMAKQLVQKIEADHGEIQEVKALFKIIFILANGMLNTEAIEIETTLQSYNASIPLVTMKDHCQR